MSRTLSAKNTLSGCEPLGRVARLRSGGTRVSEAGSSSMRVEPPLFSIRVTRPRQLPDSAMSPTRTLPATWDGNVAISAPFSLLQSVPSTVLGTSTDRAADVMASVTTAATTSWRRKRGAVMVGDGCARGVHAPAPTVTVVVAMGPGSRRLLTRRPRRLRCERRP